MLRSTAVQRESDRYSPAREIWRKIVTDSEQFDRLLRQMVQGEADVSSNAPKLLRSLLEEDD
jgi:hypothetical protein